MRTAFLAAVFAGVLAGPVLAQAVLPDAAPIALNDGSVATPKGTPIEQGMATGVPGVGLDSDGTTEGAGATKGPGGLQNGVGGEGTLAPSSTGSNDDIVDTQPAGDPGEGGIALPLQAAPAR